MNAGHCGASLSKQYAKDYNSACTVRIHTCPFVLPVEVSKLVWHFLNKSWHAVIDLLSSLVSTASRPCWRVLIHCSLASLASADSAARCSRWRVLICCNLASLQLTWQLISPSFVQTWSLSLLGWLGGQLIKSLLQTWLSLLYSLSCVPSPVPHLPFSQPFLCSAVSESQRALSLFHLCWSLSLSSTANSEVSGVETH